MSRLFPCRSDTGPFIKKETIMHSIIRTSTLLLVAVLVLALGTASAQINFEKTDYYLSLGDSVAAGEGALPVTQGFVYRLYNQNVFSNKQDLDFANIAIKGVTSEEVLALQVPQALCVLPPRIAVAPSVITLSAGANDFLVYMTSPGFNPGDIPYVAQAIAGNVENIIRSLVFGNPLLPDHCATGGLPGVTVLVSNYYRFHHPYPDVDFLLNLALDAFDESMRDRIAQIQADIDAAGSPARVGYVDTLSAMEGQEGLLLIEKRNGFNGPFDFEIHPTNAGHRVIAAEFEKVWESLQ
jgi:lysophospholipase L1-like esterase